MGSFSAFDKAVQVECVVRDIYAVDLASGTYTINVEVCARWYDPAYDSAAWLQAAKDGLKKATVTSYCMPHLTVRDVLEGVLPEFEDPEHIGAVDLLLGDAPQYRRCGIVEKRVNTILTIRDDNEIRGFPFDRQDLSIEIDMPFAGDQMDGDFGRYLLPYTVVNQSVHQQPTWAYHRMVSHIVSPPRCDQRIVCIIRISRVPWMYITKIALIVFLTTLLTWSVYMVPIRDVADRGSITLTLLLTAVAFQLVLQDDLPKVPYLTYLDKYVLASFILIFVVVGGTMLVAFLVGVENTAFCGGECALDYNRSKESVFDGSGHYTLDESIYVELWLQMVFMFVWLVINLLFIVSGTWETYLANTLFGRTFKSGQKQVSAERIARDGQDFPFYTQERERKRRMSAKNKRKESGRQFSRVVEPPTNMMQSLQDGQETRAIKGTLLNAGLTLVYSSLGKVFREHNLSLETMRDIDPLMTWKILQKLQLDDKQSAAIMKTVNHQVDVIYMQGSSSYLFMALQDDTGASLEGQLVAKPELIVYVENKIQEASTTKAEKQERREAQAATRLELLRDQHSRGRLGHDQYAQAIKRQEQLNDDAAKAPLHDGIDMTVLANCLLGRTLLYSSATPGLSFYSQRLCRGQKGNIHTQLWYGYASALALHFMDPTKHPSGCTKYQSEGFVSCVVDVGSGETKQFYSRKPNVNTALEQIGDEKRHTNDKMQDLMKQLIDACITDVHRSQAQGGDAGSGEGGTKALAATFVKICFNLGGEAVQMKADVVRVFGTGSVRKLFASSDRTHKPTHVALAKQKLLAHLSDALKTFVKENKMLNDGIAVDDKTVEFVIMSQTEEAQFEFAAAEEALNHAIDLPIDIQRGNASHGNMAWGNGSLQGYPNGREVGHGKAAPRAITLNAGLKTIKGALLDTFLGGEQQHAKRLKAMMALPEHEGKDIVMRGTWSRRVTYTHKWTGKKYVPYLQLQRDQFAKAYEAVRNIVERNSGTTPIELFQTPDMMQEDALDDMDDMAPQRRSSGGAMGKKASSPTFFGEASFSSQLSARSPGKSQSLTSRITSYSSQVFRVERAHSSVLESQELDNVANIN